MASGTAGAGGSGTLGGVAAEVARGAERSRKEWQAAARGGGGNSGAWSSSRGPGESLEAERVGTGIARKIRSRDAAVMTVVLTLVYPVFVFSTVLPAFPTWVNALVGFLTVAVVLYTLTEPSVSLVVFGTWSVLAPLVLTFLEVALLSTTGLFVFTACWVPFALAVLLTLAMPD